MSKISKQLVVCIDYDINNNSTDISKLIKIQNDYFKGDFDELQLRFTRNTNIDPAVSVILGTLLVYARELGKKVKFRFREMKQHPVFKFMQQVGMYEYLTNCNDKLTTEYAIPFNQISNDDEMEHCTDKIMELAPIEILGDGKDILSSYFYEVYQNSLYHAKSPIDVFSCGYWMESKNKLIFSIYDMGIGIPKNVRNHVSNDLSSKQCIEWALTEGKSTIEDELVKRGLGLSRLEEFIKLNNGTMSIYSDDICCIIKNKGRDYIDLDSPIMGTLIIINIIADSDHIYIVD